MEIPTQEEWVLRRLEKFYSVKENLDTVKSILNGETNISLRLIEDVQYFIHTSLAETCDCIFDL